MKVRKRRRLLSWKRLLLLAPIVAYALFMLNHELRPRPFNTLARYALPFNDPKSPIRLEKLSYNLVLMKKFEDIGVCSNIKYTSGTRKGIRISGESIPGKYSWDSTNFSQEVFLQYPKTSPHKNNMCKMLLDFPSDEKENIVAFASDTHANPLPRGLKFDAIRQSINQDGIFWLKCAEGDHVDCRFKYISNTCIIYHMPIRLQSKFAKNIQSTTECAGEFIAPMLARFNKYLEDTKRPWWR